ncbi:MAG: FtsQ-type POTRA domain-containing protein [Oscillospiraceae bacterium]|jgi:cell division septal protein FtsQ|nr:FtsQ-type POTRA domain-containing protein [Oscillospiraceae bacterium]
MAGGSRKNGRRRRGAAVYTPVAALLALFIIIFGVSVFFRVERITVTGSMRYTEDEIISASGIERGDNLFFMDRDAAARRITGAMPYVAVVRIERRAPGTAVIEITESRAVAAVAEGGSYWKIDSGGRVLERTDFAGTAGLIRVSGFSPRTPKEGGQLETEESYETQRGFLLEVLSAIESRGIAGDVSNLDITNISAITFTYRGDVSVNLGGGDNASFKLDKFLSELEREPGFRGRIDVSKDGRTYVNPDADGAS